MDKGRGILLFSLKYIKQTATSGFEGNIQFRRKKSEFHAADEPNLGLNGGALAVFQRLLNEKSRISVKMRLLDINDLGK